jgi:hypothetical protein
MDFQLIDIYKPIASKTIGPAPIVINALITSSTAQTVNATMTKNQRIETYVLLSSLPQELKNKVELAIQMMQAAL